MPVSEEIRRQVIEKSHGKCAICGRSDVPLIMDHIKPKSKGGRDSSSNLRAVCQSCNVLTHRTDPERIHALRETQSRGLEMEREAGRLFAEQGFAVLSGSTGPHGGTALFARKVDLVSGQPTSIVAECKWGSRPPRKEDVIQLAAYKEAVRAEHAVLITNLPPTRGLADISGSLGVSIVLAEELADSIAAFKEAGENE
jgi:hypothetical protein